MQPAAEAPIARRRTAPPELLQSLGDRFQDQCSTGQAVRLQHGRDISPFDTMPPDCVVFPTNSAEVAEVVQMCARHRVPVIAYGAGTSIEGHILAVEGDVTCRLGDSPSCTIETRDRRQPEGGPQCIGPSRSGRKDSVNP
jgi:D-lactate dehydrogenase (cytochrome)